MTEFFQFAMTSPIHFIGTMILVAWISICVGVVFQMFRGKQ